MKPSIFNLYQEVFETYEDFDDSVVKRHIKKYEELDQFLPPSNSFFIISNTHENNFPFVSKNFEYNLGLDREQMKKIGVPYWLQHIHPEEIEIWVNMLNELMVFSMSEVEEKLRPKLSYSWNCRLKTAKGNFVNIYENLVPIVLDGLGKPIIGLGYLTVIGDGEPLPITARIKLLNDQEEYETIYFKNFSQQRLTEGLSNRERDITRMIVLHKTSKEIGKAFHISPHTVDTHRRNIIKKLNLNNTTELFSYLKDNLDF